MKRVTIWVDCKDDKVEDTRRKIESFLKSQGLVHTVVDVCRLVSVEKYSK